jgi:hypothetical protein
LEVGACLVSTSTKHWRDTSPPDFADIMELRDIVAQQELRRLINYARQKDHSSQE